MKIFSISQLTNCLLIRFDNYKWAKFYKFGKDIYTVTSDTLNKKSLIQLKKDIQRLDWNIEKIKQEYI